MIEEGYKLSSDLSGSDPAYKQYLRSGSGVSLGVQGGVTEVDVQNVAEAVLTYCTFIFAVSTVSIFRFPV